MFFRIDAFINFIFIIGLNFYISGIFLIWASDYIPDDKSWRNGISIFAGIVLNILTGGFGVILLGNVIFESICYIIIIECIGFFNFGGVLYCILFPEDASKAAKIAFPIVYTFYIILVDIAIALYEKENENNLSCPTKKLNTKNSKYKIIKIINAKVNN